MRFQLVIFDLGDVLYDATQWRTWLTEYLCANRLSLTYVEVCQEWERWLVPVYRGQVPYWHRFDDFVASLPLSGEARSAVKLGAREKAASLGGTPLFDGVPELLEQIKESGIHIAALSDTESSGKSLRDRLNKWGIDKYFDAVVSSADIGFIKPEPQAYQSVLERLQVPAEHSVFVGHDEDELRGAMNVGMTAIAYHCGSHVSAHHIIHRLDELISLLY